MNKEADGKKPLRRVLHKIKNIVLVIFFVILAFVIATTVISRVNGSVPKVFGYSILRVSSGSMQPALKVGEVIIVADCRVEDIRSGDIITYKALSGTMAGELVTHRVVQAPYERNGEMYLRTKGDSNDTDDGDIKSSQVYGKLVTTVPILNMLYDFFVTPWGLITVIVLIIAAFFNEIVNFVRALAGDVPDEERESVQDIIERIQNEEQNNDE